MTRIKGLLSSLTGGRKKSKGMFGMLLSGQKKTEKKNKMYPRRK